MNYVMEQRGIDSVPVGVYNSTLKQYKAYKRAILWPGNVTEAPLGFLQSSLCDAIKVTAKGSNTMMGEGSTIAMGMK